MIGRSSRSRFGLAAPVTFVKALTDLVLALTQVQGCPSPNLLVHF